MSFQTPVPKKYQYISDEDSVHQEIPEDYCPVLIPPLYPGQEGWDEMWRDTLELQAAALRDRGVDGGFDKEAARVLSKYYKTDSKISRADMENFFGENIWSAASRILDPKRRDMNWADVGMYNKTDLPIDTYCLVFKWLEERGVPFKEKRTFLEGKAIGYGKEFLETLSVKCVQTFYEKKAYNMCRPETIKKILGVPFPALYSYRKHGKYPAKHSEVAEDANQDLNKVFDFSNYPIEKEMTNRVLFVQPMGRSVAVHTIDDNLAGLAMAGNPNYTEYLKAA